MKNDQFTNEVLDIIGHVVKWNKDRNLDKNAYNHFLQQSFIVEELLEPSLTRKKDISKEDIRNISKQICLDYLVVDKPDIKEIADSWGDIIIFAIGALYSLCVNYDLDIKTILAKILIANDLKGKELTLEGKIKKNKNFKEPEL